MRTPWSRAFRSRDRSSQGRRRAGRGRSARRQARRGPERSSLTSSCSRSGVNASVSSRFQLERPRGEPLALHDVEVRVRSGRCRCMTRIRVAVAPDAGPAVLPERLTDRRADDDAAQRHVPGRDALGEGDDVRLEAEAAAREPVSDAAEAADHLVRDEEDAALTADRAEPPPGSPAAAAGRPPAPMIGSQKNAATRSAPLSIACASTSAESHGNAERVAGRAGRRRP